MLTIGRYLIARYRFPELDRLGILTGGIGIRKRARTLGRYWNEHLKRSRATIERWIDLHPGKSVAVLGAGSLLDLNLSHLSRRFAEITLVDADPLLLPQWKRLAKRHSHSTFAFETIEITRLLLPWSQELARSLEKHPRKSAESWAQALKTIRSIPEQLSLNINSSAESSVARETPTVPKQRALSLSGYDCVISLNLLSQLPLCWQDAVGRELMSRFGEEWLARHEESWLLAAREGGQKLVLGHLAQLARSDAAQIILLTDVEYLFYHSSAYRLVEEPPLYWKSTTTATQAAEKSSPLEPEIVESAEAQSGTWEPNERYNSNEFTFELMNALSGVQIESAEILQKLFVNYQIRYGAPWIWNLVPFGAEEKSEGELHRVLPVHFLRNK